MNPDFRKCLENNKLVPFPSGKKLIRKELSVARSDLSDAKAGFDSQRLQMVNNPSVLCYVPCCQRAYILPGLP